MNPSSSTSRRCRMYIPPEAQWPVKLWAPTIYTGELPDASSRTICVKDGTCFYGSANGLVIEVDSKGRVRRKYRLESSVMTITRDGDFIYVGCKNSCIYDLTGRKPRCMFEIEGMGHILSMDMRHGQIAVGGNEGLVALLNYEGEIIWKNMCAGVFSYMVCIDDAAVYHGNFDEIIKHSLVDGSVIWRQELPSSESVYSGVQTDEHIYVGIGPCVRKLEKSSGSKVAQSDVSSDRTVYANEVVDDMIVIAGRDKSKGFLAIIDQKSGKFIYDLVTVTEIQCLQCHQGRIYAAGLHGFFACFDFSSKVIKNAMAGKQVESTDIPCDNEESDDDSDDGVTMVTMSAAGDGVIVHCVQDGTKIRVRPLSPGYHKTWNVQFPRKIRKAGAKFIVDELKQATGFYRAFGNIKQIQD